MCNYRLLAEKQIAQKKYTPEEQIEIWKEAANQYSYIEDGEKEEECLKEAIKIAENKKKSTEFVEIRYILQVYSRHLTL